jgi:putative DNA primase/helicase
MQNTYRVAQTSAIPFNLFGQTKLPVSGGGLFSNAVIPANIGFTPSATNPAVATSKPTNIASDFNIKEFLSEVTTTVEAGQSVAPVAKARKGFSPGEVGHSQRFASFWGESTRFDANRGIWMIWRGTHWAHDENNEVIFRMTRVAANILENEGRQLRKNIDQVGEMYAAMARKLREEGENLHNYQPIMHSLSLAKVIPSLVTNTRDYDADPMLFNCKNGTIDLRDGVMRPHHSADLLTKVSPVPMAPVGTDCPRWKQFLLEIMVGDTEMVDYLQRVVGYILTGKMTEQCFFLFYGCGANGKSVFIDLVEYLLGEYSQSVDFTTFMDLNRGGAPRNDLAALVGKRLVVAPEGKEGTSLDEGVIKQFTGGDTISVRFLHQEFFQFKPVGKVLLATNHKPAIRGTDEGVWRRMRLIPFLAEFKDERRDPFLTEKLRAEAPAILRWAMEGTQLWLKQGLGMPKAVKEATMEYRSSMDVMQTFLDECCTLQAEAKIGSQPLYDEYLRWCQTVGIRIPMKQATFNMRLKDRGFLQKKTTLHNVWLGLKLMAYGTSVSSGEVSSTVMAGAAAAVMAVQAVVNDTAMATVASSITAMDDKAEPVELSGEYCLASGDLDFGL